MARAELGVWRPLRRSLATLWRIRVPLSGRPGQPRNRPVMAIPFLSVDRPATGQIDLWFWTSGTLSTLPLERPDWLSASERIRIQCLPQAKRESAVRMRCAVRAALAAYRGGLPRDLDFSYGQHGKPQVNGEPKLHFSVTHTRGCALLAVSLRGPVGVDVEPVRLPARDELAKAMLGARAWRQYQALDDVSRGQAFARAWTEREALVKAMGLGIAHGWSPCLVWFAELPLQVCAPGPSQVAGWTLASVPVDAPWVATVCTAQPAGQVRQRSWLATDLS